MSASEVKRFEGLAAAQIKEHKPALVTACYKPTEADRPSAPDGTIDPETLKKVAAGSSNTVTVMIVFDEEGNEATREVLQESETSAGIARCVGENLPALTVPAPKRKVRVKVPLRIP